MTSKRKNQTLAVSQGEADAEVPVRRTPMSLSRRFVQICTAAAAEALAEENLTPLESGVLAYLSRISGEPNIDQNGLAARMGVDRSHASLLVDKLAARGLLNREVNPENRRAHILSLTPTGEKTYARTRPGFNAGQQKILSVLRPAERELLLDLLVRVVEGNRALARPGAGRRKRATSVSTTNQGAHHA
jgi:DNA-binding MarR family transcriptional regulator